MNSTRFQIRLTKSQCDEIAHLAGIARDAVACDERNGYLLIAQPILKERELRVMFVTPETEQLCKLNAAIRHARGEMERLETEEP